MIDPAVREARLVVEDQRDAILSRNISRRDGDEFVPVKSRIERNRLDCSTRNLAADSGAVEHSRQGHVVDVPRGSRDFVAAFLARYRCSDDVLRHVTSLPKHSQYLPTSYLALLMTTPSQ